MIKENRVVVLQLPERLVQGKAQLFFQEIQTCLTSDRPRLVFDFSACHQLDSAGLQMLLNSAEEVMKRNGDLKLAALRQELARVLELTRIDSLFEIFENAAAAVESFYQLPVDFLQTTTSSEGPFQESGSLL